jgi:lysophospholipase L1-like esterase
MKNIFLISLLFIMLTACTKTGSKSFIPADNRNISYIGRFDFSNKLKPVFMYSGCAIRTCFNGTSVEMVMKDDSLRNMFNVIIDDSLSIIKTDKNDSIYLLAANLQDKKHTLEIIRRTEWHGGNTTFMGFRLDKGKRLNKPATKDRKVEFIGDSYTCGYGIEGKSHEDHFTYQTENNYLTFGAITARDLNAEFLTVCRSGIGVWQSYGGGKDFTMPKLYDEVIIKGNKVWDYKQYVPQLVAIDLASNDLSVALDSAKFISTYVEFLQRIRKNYPSAKIVCLAGPCSPGDEWNKTRSYVHLVVDEYKKTDNSTYYFEFSTFEPNGSDFHPNLEQHKNMANELVPFLKKLMNW